MRNNELQTLRYRFERYNDAIMKRRASNERSLLLAKVFARFPDKTKADELGPKDMAAYIAERHAEGATRNQIGRELGAVKAFYRWLNEVLGRLEVCPVGKLAPSVGRVAVRPTLIESDVHRLLYACRNDMERLHVALGLFCGAKPSELNAIRWSDVGPEGIKIGTRLVPLRADVRRLVERIPPQGEFLLSGYAGTRSRARQRFNNIKRRAQVKDFPYARLRRVMATWMLRAGASVRQVQTLLGYSSQMSTIGAFIPLAETAEPAKLVESLPGQLDRPDYTQIQRSKAYESFWGQVVIAGLNVWPSVVDDENHAAPLATQSLASA